MEESDSKVRENADKAKELKGKILNLVFLLTLSGLVDIYEQFGAMVQITQMVHLLPHERLNLVNKEIRGFTILSKHPVRAAGLSVTTRKQAQDNIVLAGIDPEKTNIERLMKLVKELSTNLNNKVYSAEGKSVIEQTRAVHDLTSLALKLKEHGASPVNLFPLSIKSSRKLLIQSLLIV